jgi:hypothetical protein
MIRWLTTRCIWRTLPDHYLLAVYNRRIGLGTCLVSRGTLNGLTARLGMPSLLQRFLDFVSMAGTVACLLLFSDLYQCNTPSCLWYAVPSSAVNLSLPSSVPRTNVISYKLVCVSEHFIFVLLMVRVVSNHEGWGSVPGQVLWDCWWTKWHCYSLISKYSIFCSQYHSASARKKVIYLLPCCIIVAVGSVFKWNMSL